MPSPLKWIRRRIGIQKIGSRRREIENELSCEWRKPVRLIPASVKGGYDEIFHIVEGRTTIAMMRLNSPFKKETDPVEPHDPSIPLPAAERLDREWSAYSTLSEDDLSPKPLWRTHDAIATSWLPAERLSIRLARRPAEFWTHIGPALAVVSAMHDAGITHLDLNTGNLLVSPESDRIHIIDFEFGPVEWLRKDQEFAFDYLRLIDDFLKPRRGARQMLADTDRLVALLEKSVFSDARQAPCAFAMRKLGRLAENTELRKPLESVFERLRD